LTDDAAGRALHELRGPLAALRLGVELGLREGRLGEERLRALELELARAARALGELEHLLCGGVGRRGGLDATTTGPAPLALGPVLSASVAAWRPAASGRAVRLTGADGVWVVGERVALAQAVGNLLANAIEHGAGPVSARVRAGSERVRVEIADQGPGLGAPLAELLRRPGHHGLRVAAEVAGACGGRLLSAPAECGARLVLELPRARVRARGRGRRRTTEAA
jgi:signal transduction histidine kinase